MRGSLSSNSAARFRKAWIGFKSGCDVIILIIPPSQPKRKEKKSERRRKKKKKEKKKRSLIDGSSSLDLDRLLESYPSQSC